ncbi:MAG: hypothetical protein KME31_32830 [Tolypothrix carrinoi HA7290-LM1]|nr:hypothetical protein [Tolypothrix carrinoi HA7290-LM1]
MTADARLPGNPLVQSLMGSQCRGRVSRLEASGVETTAFFVTVASSAIAHCLALAERLSLWEKTALLHQRTAKPMPNAQCPMPLINVSVLAQRRAE